MRGICCGHKGSEERAKFHQKWMSAAYDEKKKKNTQLTEIILEDFQVYNYNGALTALRKVHLPIDWRT